MGGYILAVVSILVGGGVLTFGYRFLYEALFTIGFGAGGLVTAVIAQSMFADKSWMALGSWVAFIVGGVFCGGIVLWTYPKSSFVAGMAAGIMLAGIVTNSAASFMLPGHTTEVFQMFSVVFGVLFVAFDLKFSKPVQIASTSIFGAGILAWGVGFFVGEFPFPNDLEMYAEKNTNGELVYSIPSVWWGYLLGIVVLSAFGILIQSRKTARSPVDDEFEGFGPDGFGYPIDAVPYVEPEKPGGTRPSVPVMENFTTAARDSDVPSSYVHQSFCRLYSRNTEALSIEKTRAKFLEERAQSIDMKNPAETTTSQLQPPVKNASSRGVQAGIQEEEL
ncbi:hypothetical protein PHYBOEH_006175 [Phytophthora boehmeriae]|uniref:Transmembrane protein 198 n=1 Tax=Phytophthora boehmeriae TaxID=109152 RepID=A0A8T1WN90_9STRA|nr:hypothetical protein PHYBOEH_006175 [Phytophthora boehmeriae]